MGVPYGGQKRGEDQNTSVNFTDLQLLGYYPPPMEYTTGQEWDESVNVYGDRP